MSTHHGRPGGRLVELLALFAFLGLSVAMLVGMPILVMYFLDAPEPGRRTSILAGLALALVILAPIWKALLRYYKYEPHTLKPILRKEKTHDGRGD